jgi:hypothetical protein
LRKRDSSIICELSEITEAGAGLGGGRNGTANSLQFNQVGQPSPSGRSLPTFRRLLRGARHDATSDRAQKSPDLGELSTVCPEGWRTTAEHDPHPFSRAWHRLQRRSNRQPPNSPVCRALLRHGSWERDVAGYWMIGIDLHPWRT